MSDHDNPGSERPKPLQVFYSIVAALFGVQSQANRERDFKKGSAGDYIGVFVVLVLALVVGVFLVVKMVLNTAGS